MSYSKVEDGKIIASGIEKGTVYAGKKYGAEDPDSVYITFGLLPEVGDPPDFNPDTQECAGPAFVLDGNVVNRVWTVTSKSAALLASEQKEKQATVDKLAAQVHLNKTEMPTEITLEVLRERIVWLEKIILAN